MSQEEYKKKNIKLATFYFFILILVQIIGIAVIITFFLSNVIMITLIALLIGIVAPLLVAKLLIMKFKEKSETYQ
ncbi:MAG: hypothetical protein J7L47_03445 [Candidatus Odinarchaeota archaeon]|nr:hypothetical protein [Candidatus Odinarchaeota archaeon]